jgi:deoxycytidylate deaminase
MREIEKLERPFVNFYFQLCEQEARKSLCLRKKGGSIIVDDEGVILGTGFNGPPGNTRLERCLKDEIPKNFKSDRTCCIHAEQRAITDALSRYGREKLVGTTLYYLALDLENRRLFAGRPYCTICSKFALDVGIKEFVLWHEEGIVAYDTREYNELSFAFRS